MNTIQKIALSCALIMGFHATAGLISLDSLVRGKKDEATVRKALLDCVIRYGKVVLYFCFENGKACATTKDAIAQLLSQYPDVMFVLVDLAQYPYLKNGVVLKFHLNGMVTKEAGALNKATLKALLNQCYR